MAIKGIQTIKGREPLLRQLIFELRYRHGFSYLDRCGRILNKIAEQHQDWLIGNEINPQNAALYNVESGSRFTFSPTRLDLALDRQAGEPISEDDASQFVKEVGEMTALIIDELSLAEFVRIGVRALYYFQGSSRADTEDWLQKLEVFQVNPKLMKAFSGGLDAAGVSVVLTGGEYRYRLAFNGVEIAAQWQVGNEVLNFKPSSLPTNQQQRMVEMLAAKRKVEMNTGYAAIIDVDAYHDNPPRVKPEEFVADNLDAFLSKIREAVE